MTVKSTLPTTPAAPAAVAAAATKGPAKAAPAPLPAAGTAAPAPGQAVLPQPPAAGRSSSVPAAGAIAAASPGTPAGGAAPMIHGASVSIFFGSGSADIDANGQQLVRALASAQKASGPVLEITGFVDRRGNRDANVELARRRAVAVRDALFQAGMAGDRVRLKPPADVVGSGSDAEARRVEIALAR